MVLGRLISGQVAGSWFRRFLLVDCNNNQLFVDNTKQLLYIERFSLMARLLSQSVGRQNRLSLERSPYLLQHAANPVDWYPWCEEAIEKAREENKLIFLSVGYSTCHWCHVMERESFENEDIASLMNQHFINIKVDREERPDLDKVYMTFVQASTGRGGWPMSVWLTPQLTPVFGGTYFPPGDQYGHKPGFKSLIGVIQEQWEKNQDKFIESGARVIEVLKSSCTLDNVSNRVPDNESVDKCLQQLVASYEPVYGGFSQAPKFPQPTILTFLLNYYARDRASEGGKTALDMCIHTLTMMAKGGIHDHVAQGFSRYSTDTKWHVPHFEKMLYDQAQLAVAYAMCYTVTKEQFFADILRDILSYVSRDLSDQSGGFYSAEDADSLPSNDAVEKREGAFCVWTFQQIQSLISEPIEGTSYTCADIYCFHYNILPAGNVNTLQDPHNELKGQNVMMINGSLEETSSKFQISMEKTVNVLEKSRRKLFDSRLLRPRPHLDSKMISSWNGLMISGFSKASQALRDPSYESKAISAANFLKNHMYNSETGILLRSCYKGEDGNIAQNVLPITGFLDDYAFVIRGLLDLYETCLDSSWLGWAETLQDTQDTLFWDPEDAGYFTSAFNDSSLILRMKEDQDGAEPSGNSVAASNLIRLSSYLERSDFYDKATRLLQGFSTRLNKIPVALPELTSALMMYNDSVTQIFVTGQRTDKDTSELLDLVYSRLVPGRVLALADGRMDSVFYCKCAVVKGMKPLKGQATAYVCRHHTCLLPVNTSQALAQILD